MHSTAIRFVIGPENTLFAAWKFQWAGAVKGLNTRSLILSNHFNLFHLLNKTWFGKISFFTGD